MTQSTRGYRDLHEHLQALDERGLLRTIDRPIDKDSELHPLVRWQFVGGMDEDDRKAFLFTNIVDGRGRKYDIPVVVGAIAANPQIYSVGMDAKLEDIQAKWDHAIAHPIAPRLVNEAVCHEVVIEGEALKGEGHGLDALPIPVSTPGFDSAPTLTATNVITRDPESGIQNMGTYRAALKAPDRLVVRMATRVGGAGGYQHYLKYQKRGEPMPCAIVLGCPPYVAFMGPQKLPIDVDEFTVAGGLAGEPINVVRARNGRSAGAGRIRDRHRGLDRHRLARAGSAVRRVARPRRAGRIQHADEGDRHHPSREAGHSVLHQPGGAVGIERDQARRLRAAVPFAPAQQSRHQAASSTSPCTSRSPACCAPSSSRSTRACRARKCGARCYGAAFFKGDSGKICIAVNDDISADNADALLWAMAYRMNPVEDVQIVPHRGQGHGPKREHDQEEDSTLLMDATMKGDMPPLALPKKEYMERAQKIWNELGFEPLRPQPPWFGYSLGDWLPQWDEAAKRAALGRYLENGLISAKLKRKGLKPETKFRPDKDGAKGGNGKA